MQVKDVLKAKGNAVIAIAPGKIIKDAINEIIKNKIGALLVMDGESLVGIITERDIFREFSVEGEKVFEKKIEEVMTTNIIVGLPDDDLEAVKALMTNNRFRHLPIMDNKKVVGIVSIGDIVKIFSVNFQIENRYLKDYISGKYPG